MTARSPRNGIGATSTVTPEPAGRGRPSTQRMAGHRAASDQSGPRSETFAATALRAAILNVDDLADHAHVEGLAAGRSEQRLLAVLLVLYPEVFQVGVLVVASGTAANALAAGTGACTARTLLRLYPRESDAMLKASVRTRRLFPLSPLRLAIEAFHERLGSAKQASLGAIAAELAGSDLGSLAVAAEGWRPAAAATAALLRQLRRLLLCEHVPVADDELDELLRLLAACEAGLHPLLDAAGEVRLPGQFERRRTERARLSAPAVVTTASGEYHAVIRDMSSTGLGLDVAHDLPVGIGVVVRAGPTLTLDGVIVWSEAGRLGVRLSTPLTGADPFYGFCARAT